MVKNTKIIWHEILLYENFWHEKSQSTVYVITAVVTYKMYFVAGKSVVKVCYVCLVMSVCYDELPCAWPSFLCMPI